MSLVANDSCVEPRFAPMSQSDDWIIRQAIALLEQRVFKKGPSLERPAAVKDYLRLKLAAEPNEVFAIVFLNSMHEVLAYEPMFRGTIHSTSVHARPIVQRALELNAAAVIFSPTPFGLHGAVERGPCVDPNAEGRVVADRREGAGSPHRRPGHAVLVRGIRPAVATASAP